MKTFFLSVGCSSNAPRWEINMHIHGRICWTPITDNCFRECVCEARLKGCRRTIACRDTNVSLRNEAKWKNIYWKNETKSSEKVTAPYVCVSLLYNESCIRHCHIFIPLQYENQLAYLFQCCIHCVLSGVGLKCSRLLNTHFKKWMWLPQIFSFSL